jgi:hypothetical protein
VPVVIKVKLGCFWFGRNVIIGIARLLSSGTLDRCIQFSGSGATIKNRHPDHHPLFFYHQGILIAEAVVLLAKKVG